MKIYEKAELSTSIKLDWENSWYLWGSIGSGKTHNCYGLLHKWNNALMKLQEKNEKSGIYGGYPWLRLDNWAIKTDELRNTPLDLDIYLGYNRREKEKILINCKHLVIDDIGAEKRSDYTDDLLMRLLEHRYSNGFYTGFTSNLSIGELPYDARIISRVAGIVGNNKFELTGKDRRITR